MKLRLLFYICLLFAVALVLFTENTLGSPSPKQVGSSGGSRSGLLVGKSTKKKTKKTVKKILKKSKKKAKRAKKAKPLFYKPKSSISKMSFAKNTVKAVSFYAGAKIGAKIIKKLTKSFVKGIFLFNNIEYNVDQWLGFAKKDGWLCRNDTDCTWIDRNLGCDDRKFKTTKVFAAWPWKTQLRGYCTCRYGFDFSKDKGSCNEIKFNMAAWLIALIIVLAIGVCIFVACIIWKFVC